MVMCALAEVKGHHCSYHGGT